MKIILVDDHHLFGQSLRLLLAEMVQPENIAVFKNGFDVLKHLEDNPADVVISDLQMPEINGIELTKKIHETWPEVRVLILSIDDDPGKIREAISAGASGYLLKDTDQAELIEAIEKLTNGLPYYSEKVLKIITASDTASLVISNKLAILSAREIEVLKLIAEEYASHEIADKLFVSINTVESHRKNLLKKIDVKNVVGLIKFAMRNRLVN